MPLIQLARQAMATRFEIVLPGEDESALRAAGEEALDEIERLEGRISLYKPSSEIAQVNARAAERPVRVSPAVFGLIEEARRLSELTAGAFDITVAPLVRCWGFMRGSGEMPSPDTIAEARENAGMRHLELDPDEFTVRFTRPGMMLDLGSIGKGWAIDQAAEILIEAGIVNGLIHGGTSTVRGLGENPGEGDWKIGIERPAEEAAAPAGMVALRDEALSVSAVWGKAFEHEGKRYGHVIDPRTGWPAEHGVLAAVVLASAAATDALSTAVLLADEPELELLGGAFPEMRWLRISGGGEVRSRGIEPLGPPG